MPKDEVVPPKRLKVILESPPPPPRGRLHLDSTNSSSWEEEEEERIVHLHNAFRRRHASPPLELSNELSESAVIWARKIAQAGYILYDDEDPDVGQSIDIVDVASNDDKYVKSRISTCMSVLFLSSVVMICDLILTASIAHKAFATYHLFSS